jgi:Tol biopolymer transport system component
MLVDLQTLAVTNLTNNPAADDTSAFSRDGTKLAFSSDRDGTSQIWVANADGSNPVKVTTDAVANKFFPSFDRDATHVVYFAGNPRNLYIAPVSGGPGVALTTDADKVQEKLGSWIF